MTNFTLKGGILSCFDDSCIQKAAQAVAEFSTDNKDLKAQVIATFNYVPGVSPRQIASYA